MAFHIPYGRNRFTGCYIDGSRAVFEGGGLTNNIWTAGFECCAGSGLEEVPHGIILRGDTIGPGLQIFSNSFQGGNLWHEPSSPGKVPTVQDCHISSNFGSDRGIRASKTLSQTGARQWNFDLCDQLAFPVIYSARFKVAPCSWRPTQM
mmetsp:Transcript_53131/g.172756  ORF Transcript_53131/g.172756 Transcript_53131/m.172756 type:complete len:149 (+) Transcript_53131:974-1420(+)